jgi:hypothetical protein
LARRAPRSSSPPDSRLGTVGVRVGCRSRASPSAEHLDPDCRVSRA